MQYRLLASSAIGGILQVKHVFSSSSRSGICPFFGQRIGGQTYQLSPFQPCDAKISESELFLSTAFASGSHWELGKPKVTFCSI